MKTFLTDFWDTLYIHHLTIFSISIADRHRNFQQTTAPNQSDMNFD